MDVFGYLGTILSIADTILYVALVVYISYCKLKAPSQFRRRLAWGLTICISAVSYARHVLLLVYTASRLPRWPSNYFDIFEILDFGSLASIVLVITSMVSFELLRGGERVSWLPLAAALAAKTLLASNRFSEPRDLMILALFCCLALLLARPLQRVAKKGLGDKHYRVVLMAILPIIGAIALYLVFREIGMEQQAADILVCVYALVAIYALKPSDGPAKSRNLVVIVAAGLACSVLAYFGQWFHLGVLLAVFLVRLTSLNSISTCILVVVILAVGLAFFDLDTESSYCDVICLSPKDHPFAFYVNGNMQDILFGDYYAYELWPVSSTLVSTQTVFIQANGALFALSSVVALIVFGLSEGGYSSQRRVAHAFFISLGVAAAVSGVLGNNFWVYEGSFLPFAAWPKYPIWFISGMLALPGCNSEAARLQEAFNQEYLGNRRFPFEVLSPMSACLIVALTLGMANASLAKVNTGDSLVASMSYPAVRSAGCVMPILEVGRCKWGDTCTWVFAADSEETCDDQANWFLLHDFVRDECEKNGIDVKNIDILIYDTKVLRWVDPLLSNGDQANKLLFAPKRHLLKEGGWDPHTGG